MATQNHDQDRNSGTEAAEKSARAMQWQKNQLQRRYAEQYRQSQKAAQKTRKRTEAIRRAVARFAKKHSKAGIIVLCIAVLVAMLLGGLSSCAMMVGSGISGMFAATYTASDPAMLDAEAAYCFMEEDLRETIDAVEANCPDYDHYEYELDELGHDPYVLISMLSALHGGTFTLEEVQSDLHLIFANQYDFSLTETSAAVWVDGSDRIETTLHVTLENIGMDRLPSILLPGDQLASYAAYMSTLGNREDLFAGVPGASTLKEPEYYEIPPEALEDETFAAMIAEGEKYLGYPYVWGGSSPATSFDCSGFVCWVINHSSWSVGRTTAQGLFNICTPVSGSQAKPGDLIFFMGTYDTPEVSHVGIYVGGGQMLHCGNPISYASVNIPYWQEHFYCFGRLP